MRTETDVIEWDASNSEALVLPISKDAEFWLYLYMEPYRINLADFESYVETAIPKLRSVGFFPALFDICVERDEVTLIRETALP